MKQLLTLGLLMLSLCLFGQENVSGKWSGTITQNEGGYRSSYEFEMFIQQDGNKISGRTFVYVDDIHAEMKFSGEIHSGIYVRFQESEMVDFKKFEGMEWCIKKGQLILKKSGGGPWELEGFWQGNTTFSNCIPGKVHLTQVTPRA
jgi:hypothetical protein